MSQSPANHYVDGERLQKLAEDVAGNWQELATAAHLICDGVSRRLNWRDEHEREDAVQAATLHSLERLHLLDPGKGSAFGWLTSVAVNALYRGGPTACISLDDDEEADGYNQRTIATSDLRPDKIKSQLCTRREAADLLRVTYSNVCRMISAGILPAGPDGQIEREDVIRHRKMRARYARRADAANASGLSESMIADLRRRGLVRSWSPGPSCDSRVHLADLLRVARKLEQSLSLGEAAARLGKSKSTIRQWGEAGKIRRTRYGRTWRYILPESQGDEN